MTDPTGTVEVVFHRPKAGSTEAEWEDCGGYRPAGSDGVARYVVVDGATEAYDSIRWVRQLVTAFLGTDTDAPSLTPDGLDAWFAAMQQRWVDGAPARFATIFEERKFREDGSFATFLGCDVTGLGGARPAYRVAALGDAMLFHVRRGRLVDRLPAIAADGFGLDPDGVFTQPAMRERMRAALRLGGGGLEAGDLLFLATDAMAEWLVKTDLVDGPALWTRLAALAHPADFQRLVAAERNARRMKNDDVTLMRVEIVAGDPGLLLVCR